MRKLLRKIRANKRAFTLVECVLAAALISAASTLILSLISTGFFYIKRSRSLDEMSSVAQEHVFVNVYADDFVASEGLVDTSADSGISVGYSDNLKFKVAYEIFYGSSSKTDVIMPAEYNFVAVIVTDVNENKLVYYTVSPKDGKIQKLYKEKE